MLAALLLAIFACWRTTGDASQSQRVIDALITERFTAGRLAQQTAWQKCVVMDTASLVPRAQCGEPFPPNSQRLDRIEQRLLGLSRAGQDSPPSYRRAAALFELRTADTSTRGISRAIRSLEGARRLAPHDPTVLNDLAVAYLELGQRDQRLEPMLRALDAIEQARERDSTSAPTLFNRGLIFERLYLNASARRAWSRHLAVEQNAQWRAEANQHLARLTASTRDRAWPDIRTSPPQDGGAPPATIIALVAHAPQDARDSAFALLREWGTSIRSGQKARATNVLVTVRAIARAFDSLDLDRSVSLAVHAIDASAADSVRLARMANALVDLADGTALYWKSSLDSAIACLTRAEGALHGLGSAAAHWAAFYHAWSDLEKGLHDSADQGFARLLSESTLQEPALRGKTVRGEGVSQFRRGNYENAIRLYRAARDSIARAHEPENEAGISYLLTEVLELAGQSSPGRDEAYAGLKLLSPFRRSTYLNNHLTNVASLARREGLRYAAVAIMHEVLDVAPRVGKPQVLAWAHRAYARELMMLGRLPAAHAALDSASRWTDSIPAGAVHDRVRADVQFVSAQLTRGEDPWQARKTLAAVAATFAKQKLQTHVARALYEESVAAAAAGDSADARRTLDQAIGTIERQSRSFTSTDARATFSETVENLFDEMMNRQLAAKHRDSAFVYLERGRQAAWSGGATHADRPDLDRVRSLLPPDMLVVEYAVLPTQLVVWTASKERWQADVQTIARDSIATLVDRAIEEMDNPADSASASARLFDLLLGKLPIDRSRITKLAIIPDRELSRLPFAALRDTTGRYLVESFEMRTAPSAAFSMAAFGRHEKLRIAGQALVVGNPLLDTSSAQLPPLPGALREAQGVAKAYPSPRLLTGADARRDSVLALLATSSVFHFAGHAIINSDQPELSYLALASTGSGSADDGILRAREIGNLHPSNLQLAVLSACSTLNPRPSHTGAIAGLAYSFLRAGVPATISTLWDVSDEAVTDVLVDFHRQRIQGKPAAEALRSAQVAAIKKRSAPRTWAAFIYTGR